MGPVLIILFLISMIRKSVLLEKILQQIKFNSYFNKLLTKLKQSL